MSWTDYKEENNIKDTNPFSKYFNQELIVSVKEVIDLEGLSIKNKAPNKSHLRFYLMHYLKENTYLSLSKIGELFNRDHSTVIHGVAKHNNFVDINFENQEYIAMVSHLKRYFTTLYPNSKT